MSSTPTASGRPWLPRLCLTLVAIAVFLWLLVQMVEMTLHKFYAVDEYQYAHGAWLISKGLVPYRDFFEHHFPLVHQMMAVVFRFLDDDPTNLLVLRVVMLPFVLLIVLAGAVINRSRGAVEGWLTPFLFLGTMAFVASTVEVRPDTVAFAFFLSALAVLYLPRPGPRLRGFAAGVLLALAAWGSQKVLYYGVVFVAALAADLFLRRRGEGREHLLGHPLAFAAGSAAVAVPVGLHLLLTGSLDDWFFWCLRWSFVHQVYYPGFPWVRNFLPVFSFHTGLFLFGALGVVDTVRRRAASGDPGRPHPDLLLLGAVPTTFASFAWQTAAYTYSLIPFLGITAVFAARGLAATWRWLVALGRRRPAVGGLGLGVLVLVLLGEVLHARTLFTVQLLHTNEDQTRVLANLRDLTDPGDPVYDIAGRQVSRPSVHYFYFTDAVVRSLLAERLAREIPPAIVEGGCTVYLHDEIGRFESLPPSLQRFLLENFQPWNQDIWLWGRRYRVSGEGWSGRFRAVKEGRYFVEPPEVLERGRLSVGGAAVAGPVFELGRGEHEVRWEGPAADLYLLWLPRNGYRWRPEPHPVPSPGAAPAGGGAGEDEDAEGEGGSEPPG